MLKRIRLILSPLLILLTVSLFIYYAVAHPDVLSTLARTSPLIIVLILFLYFCMFSTLMLMYEGTLRLIDRRLGVQENLLLTCYTALINFFGPLQSGPAFRAAYLKKKHEVSLKQYTIATLVYYAFYLLLNASLLFVGTVWWPLALPILCCALITPFIASRLLRRLGIMGGRYGGLIVLAIILQMLIMVCIYYVELHSVNTGIRIWQVFSYTATANLSLFVSLTPAGIGIREAFLLFTHTLHHIATNEIVAANIIDRGVYLLYMGALFIVGLLLHVNDRLQTKKIYQSKDVDKLG